MRRAETLVAALLLLAALFGFGFTVIYIVLGTNTRLLGLAMGGMLALLAAAAIIAGTLVVPQEQRVEDCLWTIAPRAIVHRQSAPRPIATLSA